MKKKRLLTVLLAVLILAAGIGIGFAASAAGGLGTQSDPLVAKSYLDNVLTPALQSQYENQLNSKVQALEQKIAGVTASPGNFIAVTLPSGSTLTGGAGCEIILTGGKVSAAGGSLTDVTSGSAIAVGGAVAANHLCVVSAEGGGVKASENATLLVRGAYSVG